MATRFRIDRELCIECGACIPECPLGAISEDPYFINPEICDGCGTCPAACPVDHDEG